MGYGMPDSVKPEKGRAAPSPITSGTSGSIPAADVNSKENRGWRWEDTRLRGGRIWYSEGVGRAGLYGTTGQE